MKRNTLARLAFVLCAAAALMLTGCGGDDGVSQGMHDDLQMDRDELMTALEAEKAKVVALTAQIDGDGTADNPGLTAQLMAANARIGSADDADSLMGMLAAATAQIGSADDADSLLGMLAAEQAQVMMLTQQIDGDGTADNPGLTAQLMAANARIGSADDAGSLMGMLAAATAQIGSADDADSLLGMLAAEQAQVMMLTQQIDGDGTADNPGLTAQLMAANARIAALEGGTAPDVLDPMKMSASDAATAAGNAATAADMAADEAEMADDNRAAVQTGDANSVAGAMYARMRANTAADEAMKAQTASTAAQGAANTAEATPHRIAAEAARDVAMAALMDAEKARDNAVADSMVELKIDDKTKSVGDTAITIDGKAQDVTVNEERTLTGLQEDMNISTTGEMIDGVQEVQPNPSASPPVVAADAIPPAQERPLDIGVVYDSAGDDVRLALVTQYAGTRTVTAFEDGSDTVTGSKSNRIDDIDHDGDASAGGVPTPNRSVPLRTASGIFIESNTLTYNGDGIGETTKPSTIYYYETSEGKTYIRRTGTMEVEDGTVYSYLVVDTRAGAKIPASADYKYLHFGVWAGLDNADGATGENAINDLGIGFISALGDITEVMPNHGRATYNGNWVATVQQADDDGDGEITLQDGVARMEANFSKAEVDVILTGLATVNGSIDGNTFSGDKAPTMPTAPEGGLDAAGKFEGSFQGAFFGPLGAEAGGVFDYSSEDNEDGAFRGAFGGNQAD